MLVELQVDGDVCILRLQGRFATGRDTAYLREKAEEIKHSDCTKVLADFREVAYIDSTGIGFLIGIYTSVIKNPGGVFGVVGPNPRVREVLELCRLDTVFPIYKTEDEAMTSVRAGRGALSGH